MASPGPQDFQHGEGSRPSSQPAGPPVLPVTASQLSQSQAQETQFPDTAPDSATPLDSATVGTSPTPTPKLPRTGTPQPSSRGTQPPSRAGTDKTLSHPASEHPSAPTDRGSSAPDSPGAAPESPDDSEADLFGDPDEEPAGEPVGQAPAPSASQVASTDADLFDEKELFGDDDAANIDEKELFGSDDEGADIYEKELFGSDEASAVSDAKLQPPPSVTKFSDVDTEEVFGAMSDEEPEKVETVKKRPLPEEGRAFASLRLPNILSVERRAFSGKEFSQAARSGCKERTNTQDKLTAKLQNPENCIRWRFKKSPDGQILTDSEGRPQYESNSRLVEWEDCSRTLFVGNEPFNISELSERVLLFEENSQEIHVCHGFINKRLVATPRNSTSATHEMLKSAQYTKYEPTRRSLLISPEDMIESKQMIELEMEQKRRQAQKRLVESPSLEDQGITAAFLEDDGGEGPSILAAKRDLKRRKS